LHIFVIKSNITPLESSTLGQAPAVGRDAKFNVQTSNQVAGNVDRMMGTSPPRLLGSTPESCRVYSIAQNLR